PIDRDADFLLDPRQFTPINAAPEKPGEKSGEVDAENPRHSGSATDRRQQSERFKTEWLLRFAGNACDDVLRDNFSFARGVLRGRRTIAASRAIRHERAIAKRPYTVNAFHSEGCLHFNPTALFCAADQVQSRCRRDARRT